MSKIILHLQISVVICSLVLSGSLTPPNSFVAVITNSQRPMVQISSITRFNLSAPTVFVLVDELLWKKKRFLCCCG